MELREQAFSEAYDQRLESDETPDLLERLRDGDSFARSRLLTGLQFLMLNHVRDLSAAKRRDMDVSVDYIPKFEAASWHAGYTALVVAVNRLAKNSVGAERVLAYVKDEITRQVHEAWKEDERVIYVKESTRRKANKRGEKMPKRKGGGVDFSDERPVTMKNLFDVDYVEPAPHRHARIEDEANYVRDFWELAESVCNDLMDFQVINRRGLHHGNQRIARDLATTEWAIRLVRDELGAKLLAELELRDRQKVCLRIAA